MNKLKLLAIPLLLLPLSAFAQHYDHDNGWRGDGGYYHNDRPDWRNRDWRDYHHREYYRERDRDWQRGYWKHGWHAGRNGWWWVNRGYWYYYPQPVYPYPPLRINIY